MVRMPRVTAREVLAAVRRDGWEVVRTRSSHFQLAHASKPGTVTIPVHARKVITPPLLPAFSSRLA